MPRGEDGICRLRGAGVPVVAFAVLAVALIAVSALSVTADSDSETITADDLVFYDCDNETILYRGVDAKDGKIVFPEYDGAAPQFYGWVNGEKKYSANKNGGDTDIEVSGLEDGKFYAIPMENPVTCKITFDANGGESYYANMSGKVTGESLVDEYIWKVNVVCYANGDTRFVGWKYNETTYIEDSILVLPSGVSEIKLEAEWADYVIYYKEKTPNGNSRLIHVQTSNTKDFKILTYAVAGGNQRDFRFTNWELHGGSDEDGTFGKSYYGGEDFDMQKLIADGARDTSVEAQGVFTYTVKYFVDGNKVRQEKVEAGQTVNLLDWRNYESSNGQFVIEGWVGPSEGLDDPEELDHEDGDDSNLVWYRQSFVMKDMDYKLRAYGRYYVEYFDYDGSSLKKTGPYYPREGFDLEEYTGSGVDFKGWNIYIDGEKAVDEENGCDQFPGGYPLDGRDDGVMKIYAVADPSPDAPVERHTINLDVNGGDLQLDPVTVTASAYAVPDYAGKKAGYDFVGWEYGGRTYTPGQSISLPSGVAEISLTAVWRDSSSPAPDPDEVPVNPVDRVVVIQTPVGPVTVEVLGDADLGDSIYVHVSMRKAVDGEGVPGMDDTTVLESYCYRLTSSGQKVPMTYGLTVSAGIDVPSGKEPVIGLYDREGAEVDGIDVTFSSGSAVFETTVDDSLYMKIGATFRTVVLPVITTGDEAYVYYDNESDFWFGKDPKSLLLIAILAAIVAELAALTISRRG